jgi:hypothetical protein
VPERSAALAGYLKAAAPDQPLQNRLTLLWTARRLKGALDGPARRDWIAEAFAKQSADGGWTNQALGPWKPREGAPPSPGSSAYATAFVTYALLESGLSAQDEHLARSLDWLRRHQNRDSGYWDAVSMNKRFPPGSMQEQFMRDAATGFASAALVKAETKN